MTRPMVWVRYAHHLDSCPVKAISHGRHTLRGRASYEAMVFDPRCDCGLRELAESMAAEWPNGTASYPVHYQVTVGGTGVAE